MLPYARVYLLCWPTRSIHKGSTALPRWAGRRSRACQGKRGGDRNAWKENFADGDGRLVYAVGTDAAVGSVIGKLQRR